MKCKLMSFKEGRLVTMKGNGELQVLEKSEIKNIKGYVAPAVPEKSEVKVVEREPIKELTPAKKAERDELLAKYDELWNSGRSRQRTGTALLIPGCILTGIGAVALIIGYTFEDSHYSDCSNHFYVWRNGGWILAGIGVPLTITGIVLKSEGSSMLVESIIYKLQANEISMDINPVFNPSNQCYGIISE